MAHPIMFDDADPILDRLRQIASALPEATEKVAHGRPTFRCGKMFAMYGGSEKKVGGKATAIRHENAVLFIPDPSEREALLQDSRFFVPAYVGPFGWLGIDLSPDCDWTEIAELMDSSFRQIAPKRAIAVLDAS